MRRLLLEVCSNDDCVPLQCGLEVIIHNLSGSLAANQNLRLDIAWHTNLGSHGQVALAQKLLQVAALNCELRVPQAHS